MNSDIRTAAIAAKFLRRILFVPLLAMSFAAGYPDLAVGQPIRMVVDGAFDIFEQVNSDFDSVGLEDGAPVRFILDFDAASPSQIVERLLIQLDGTTFTNFSDLPAGTHLEIDSTPETGLSFRLTSGDEFRGTRDSVDLSLATASAVAHVFILEAEGFSSDAGFPVDLTFEDLTSSEGGFFGLNRVPPDITPIGLFGVNLTGLSIQVIPEPTTATLVFSILGAVLLLRPRARCAQMP